MSDDRRSETAEEALEQIVTGVRRFREEVYPEQRELFKKLAHEQTPRAMFITCADSRIIPELITQSSPGDLFVTRNVGNVVPPYGQMNGGVSTAIEFAVMALGVQHIIVCGHSDCGAMKAVLNPAELKRMPTVKGWLRHAEVAKIVVEQNQAAPTTTPSASSPRRMSWRSSTTCARTRRLPHGWPVASCSSMAGCTTSKPARSAHTMPSAASGG